MATQKTLFDILQPSTMKPNQTSSARQKRKSDEDPQEISGPKKHGFSSQWLEEFAWLVYVSTENYMKCKTHLDAYERSAKPSQAFVHGATNFQRLALVRHRVEMTMLWLWKSLHKENVTKRSCTMWKKNQVWL